MTDTTGTDTTSTATTATAGSNGGASTEDVSGLKSALDKERDARKTAEKSLGDLQKRIDDLEAKDKTELERTQTERDRLKADLDSRETRLKELAVRSALTTAVTKAGAKHPDLLVDRLSRQAELDDDLNVKNVDKLVTDAKKEYPDLFRVVDGGVDGGKGRDDESTGKSDMNRLIRRQAGYAA